MENFPFLWSIYMASVNNNKTNFFYIYIHEFIQDIIRYVYNSSNLSWKNIKKNIIFQTRFIYSGYFIKYDLWDAIIKFYYVYTQVKQPGFFSCSFTWIIDIFIVGLHLWPKKKNRFLFRLCVLEKTRQICQGHLEINICETTFNISIQKKMY